MRTRLIGLALGLVIGFALPVCSTEMPVHLITVDYDQYGEPLSRMIRAYPDKAACMRDMVQGMELLFQFKVKGYQGDMKVRCVVLNEESA